MMRRFLFISAFLFGACGENHDGSLDVDIAVDTQDGQTEDTQADTAQPDISEDTTEPNDTTPEDDSSDTSSNPDVTNPCQDVACPDIGCANGSYTVEGECCPRCNEPEPTQCNSAEDCVLCTYGSAPTTVEDCYCPICPTFPMDRAQCEANTQAWENVCQAWREENPCPVARCVYDEAICVEGSCASKQDACGQVFCPDLPNCQVIQESEHGCCPICLDPQPEPDSCKRDGECGMCAYNSFVNDPSECYCVGCATTPLNAEACELNRNSYDTHCAGFNGDNLCPTPLCMPNADPVCINETCQANPNQCMDSSDCTMCPYSEVVSSAEGCRCPTFGVASNTYCMEMENAFFEHCSEFDLMQCVGLSNAMMRPPQVMCDASFVCALP